MSDEQFQKINDFLPENSNKLFCCGEIKTAYEIAVENALVEGEIVDNSINSVAAMVFGDNGNEKTLGKMRNGTIRPNNDFLYFIKEFAGEKYDYTFLAPDSKKHSLISKFSLLTSGEYEGYLCSEGGKAFSYSDIDNIGKCLLFLIFVELKRQGQVKADMLFYDYLLSEKQKRISLDPLFYNYPQDLKKSAIQNIKMIDILPYEVWYIVRSLPENEKSGIAATLWELINKITPDLIKLSAQSKDAQYFIRTQNSLISENEKNSEQIDLEISQEYQLDFIHSIPTLNPNEWDKIIQLVTLHDLFFGLYERVIALIIEVLNVQLMSLQLNSKKATDLR